MMDGYRVQHEKDWQNVDGGQAAFNKLVGYFEAHQLQVKQQYGHIKKWSREVFIALAAEYAGVAVTPSIVHEAADAYWLALTEHIQIFSDARRLAESVHAHRRPFYLITSSDARLTMQPDGQFTYDPDYSEALKRQRIELLRKRGLYFNLVSIGDPEDKPHPDFFNKAIHLAELELGHQVDYTKAIMLGDSFAGDLQTPKELLSFGLVVLREKDRQEIKINDTHQISVSDLREATKFLV